MTTITTILKYNIADTAGVVGQQPFKAKAKFNKLNQWESKDDLNKLKKFTITIPNDDFAQANIQIERSIYLPFLTPFHGIICGRSETPSIMVIDVCEKAFHLTRRIYTNDDEKKVTYTDENWMNPLWLHRRKLLVAKTKVADDVKGFPLLINVPSNTSFANNAQADGDDFVVTEDDGITVIPHEIEKYDSSTGELVLWVKAPKISDTSNFEFFIYYDNQAATNQEDIVNVWKECYVVDGVTTITSFDYAMVQHLHSSSTDSTENNNDGTDTSISYSTADIIGNAATFNAVNSKIDCGVGASISGLFGATNGGWLTLWFNANSDGEANVGHLIEKRTPPSRGYQIIVSNETAGKLKVSLTQETSGTTGAWETAIDIPINKNIRLDIFYDGQSATDDPIFWINGIERSITNGLLTESSTPTGTIDHDTTSDTLVIGNQTDQTVTFDGEIDEVRLMKSPPADLDHIIRTSYNIETDNSNSVFLLDHEEYKKAANLMAQDVLDSANTDMPAGITWTLDQDFPTTVLTASMPYKNHFEALHIIGENLNQDVWFDNKNYIVHMGIKGRTITEELDITIESNPEVNVENFSNEINLIGKRDTITTKQITDVVTTPTNLRFNYETVVANNQLTDVSQLRSIGNGLLEEFKKLTPQIKGEIDISAFERNNLQSGDIIPIYQPMKQIQGNFRIMDIKASPQTVKLSLESTETGVIRLRSVSLTGVIEGILSKIQNQSIES